MKKFNSEFYKGILDRISSNIYITDIDTDEIVYMNDYMKKTFHLEEVEGKTCWEVFQRGMTERCDFCKIDHLKNMEENASYIWRERNMVTGKVYTNCDRLVKIGSHTYHIQDSTDITEHLRLSMEATTDELTGMFNRNAGKKHLEKILKDIQKGETVTVALYDIDGLKWVNDTWGHLEGDRLLAFIAHSILEELEKDDFAFRLSGDEFIIVFMNKNISESDQWMKQMLDKLYEKRKKAGFDYEVTFSYGFAQIFGGENLTVSDVLSIADTQMYIQKRDYHILKGQKRLEEQKKSNEQIRRFQYNKDYLFDVLSDSVDDYVFVGNLKTGRFMYSYKMLMDFGLPGQVLDNAAAFWSEKIHPDDAGMFLRSNQEIADGRADRHTIVYRAKNIKGEWVHLMCKGQMVRDMHGEPDLFAGIIRNLERSEEKRNEELKVISDSSTDGIFKAAMTEGFPILYANDGYYELHGYTRKQMAEELNNHAEFLVYEGDIERVQREITEGLEKNAVRLVLEYRIRKRNGSIAWVHVNAGITHFQDGPFVLIGMIMDITERREMEERLRRTEQLFKVGRTHTRLSMWELDIRKRRIIQTDESIETHGFGEIIENVPESLIECGYVHPESAAAIRRLYRDVENGKETASAEVCVRVKDREDAWWWEKITYKVVQQKDGKALWAVGLSEDVTAQREAENRVFEEETMRELLTEDLIFGFRVNMDRNRLEEFWEYSVEKAEPENAEGGYGEVYNRILDMIANEDDRMRFRTNYTLEKIQGRIAEGRDITDFEFRYKQKSGRIIWAGLNMKVAVSPEMREKIVFGYAKDIDLLKKNELALKKRAELDAVSGFYNASTAKLLIEEILKKSPKKKNDGMIMLMDVDHFKEVNRKGGYLAGDQVLYELSSELNEMVSSSSVKARIGGDLFLIFCYDIPEKEQLRKNMEKVREGVCRKYRVENDEFEVTVSAGISMRFSEGMTYEQMYKYALYTLNMAKRKGGNQLLFYRDIERMDEGLDIQMTIDPVSYEILDMNATGQIELGFNNMKDSGLKCYELLHHRKEPCTFCYKRTKAGESAVRECFVPRLNKIMYVQEHLDIKEGRPVRKIQLRENIGNESEENRSLKALNFMEEFWRKIQTGEYEASQTMTFIHYIGSVFKAHHISLYEKQDNIWRLEESWRAKGVYEDTVKERNVQILEAMLQVKFPNNVMVIEDKNSVGYERVCEFYGGEELPLPLVLVGAYADKKLEMFLLLEKIQKDGEVLKALSLGIQSMFRTRRMHKMQKNYEYILSHDSHTGCLNYQSYIEYLHNANEDIHSAFGIVGTQMVGLEDYNKKYGIRAGDQLLQFVADALEDIFGKEFCYRVSGAGFRVVCPDLTYENLLYRSQMLEEKLEEKYKNLFIFAKVWEQTSISVERLHYQVEEKLQVARTAKQNYSIRENEQTIAEIRKGVQSAIEDGEFCTFFQPKADTVTGEICGAEALIRYQHAEKGIIPPGRFLPAIERAGLVRYIDLFVLEDVCRIIKEWMDLGWKPFPISLNYSRMTILEPGILEETERIVKKMGIPKHLIEIEVTESIGSIDSVSLRHIVDEFVERGYKIALDDFGAEYSNMYALYSLNLNSLKLDRRIVSDLYHDQRARIVIKNVIDACKTLGIICVAEGVETEEHLGVLREMSCDVIQGYYLNKPLSKGAFQTQYVKKK